MSNRLKSYPLQSSPLFRVGTRRDLAAKLGISMKELKLFSGKCRLYTHFAVAKKNGGVRQVDNPRGDLKRVQRTIARLLGRITPPEFLFCPVKGRSYVSNAAAHRGSRVIHSLDIQKYFPNTPSRRVYTFFHRTMGCATDVAAVLASIACCDQRLPTGSPLSPIMAFFAHIDVWGEVVRIAQQNNCIVTIYIDDVTISGERVPTWVIWQIKQVIRRGGLRYHKEKRAVGRGAEITGVIVREGELQLPNRQRLKMRNLRREKDRERLRGEKSNELAGKIAGMKGQIAQIAQGNQQTIA